MCLILTKPPGAPLDEGLLRCAWNHNPNGAGYMFASAGKVHIRKGFMALDEFLKAMKDNEDFFKKKSLVLHFRIATHGSVSQALTHPFRISDDLAMAHNGIIGKVAIPKDRDISDSAAFVEQYLMKYPADFYKRREYTDLIEDFIGYSKLAFLDSSGEITILNESHGTWDTEGRWHSNECCIERPKPKYYYHGQGTDWNSDGVKQWFVGEKSADPQRPFVGETDVKATPAPSASSTPDSTNDDEDDCDVYPENSAYCYECGKFYEIDTTGDTLKADEEYVFEACDQHEGAIEIRICEECGHVLEGMNTTDFCQNCWEVELNKSRGEFAEEKVGP